MTTEWQDLPNMEDVVRAKVCGWEIETQAGVYGWGKWLGKTWEAHWKFRGRPRQPAMKKVKQLCFFSASGLRYDMLENGKQHRSIGSTMGWIRVPSEDKEFEVPA
jgi:hypothetical protein